MSLKAKKIIQIKLMVFPCFFLTSSQLNVFFHGTHLHVSHSVTSWDLVKVSFLHAYDSLVFYIYTRYEWE